MFIQCQNCNSRFKFDESRIPQGKSFVRCPSCSEPIPFKGQGGKADAQEPRQLVQCTECDTQYAIPRSSFKGDHLKVRCGSCGNTFQVEAEGGAPGEITLGNIKIPKENQIDAGSLFDDDDDDADGFEPTESLESFEEDEDDFNFDQDDFKGDEEPDAEREYEESIRLDAIDGDEDGDLMVGSVPEDQKYKFFKKPGAIEGDNSTDDVAMREEDQWPEIQDETDDLSLDDDQDHSLDEEFVDEPSQEPEELEAETLQEFDFQELPDNLGQGEDDLKAKEQPKKKSSSASRSTLYTFLLLLLLGLIGFVLTRPEFSQFQKINLGQGASKTQIQIAENLKGEIVTGKAGQFFVLRGKLTNRFPVIQRVENIQVTGRLYDPNSTRIGQSHSLAGLVLDQKELQDWDRAKLEQALDPNASSRKLTYSFGQESEFMILFFDLPQRPIDKLEAAISGYLLDGQPVSILE